MKVGRNPEEVLRVLDASKLTSYVDVHGSKEKDLYQQMLVIMHPQQISIRFINFK